MELVTSNPESVSISLKEITDMLPNVRHDEAIIKVRKLAEQPSFGIIRDFRINTGKRGRPTNTVLLNKKQALAVGAMLDNANLMLVINKLEELEGIIKNKPMSKLDMIIASAQEQKKLQLKVEQLEQKVVEVQHKMAEDVAEVVRGVKDKQYIPKGYLPIGTIADTWDTGLSRGTLKIVARTYNVDTEYYQYQNEQMFHPQQHIAVSATDMRWAIGQFIRTINKRTEKKFYSPQYKGGATGFSMSEDIWDMYGINQPKWD